MHLAHSIHPEMKKITNRPDDDWHHTGLIQALEPHGFEMLEHYIHHQSVGNVQ